MALGEDIYTGAADFGQIQAIISLVISTILGVIFLAVGIYMVSMKDMRTEKVIALVTNDPDCNHMANSNVSSWNCGNIAISYNFAGNPYTANVSKDSDNQIRKDSTFDIWVNPTNPTDVKTSNFNYFVFGVVLILASIFLLIYPWLNLWLTRKYKFYAAASGAASAWNMFTRR